MREEKENFARFLLRIRHELGPTIVWVEHDMQMVTDLADRIIVLNYGEVIAEGKADTVRRDPRVVEAYLGNRGPLDGRTRVLSAGSSGSGCIAGSGPGTCRGLTAH